MIRWWLVISVAVVASGCAKRRCEEARQAAKTDWEHLQAEVDKRVTTLRAEADTAKAVYQAATTALAAANDGADGGVKKVAPPSPGVAGVPTAANVEQLEERARFAQARLEQTQYWSEAVHDVLGVVAAPYNEHTGAAVSAAFKTVGEVTGQMHEINDPTLNAVMTPARYAMTNAVAACPPK